MNKLLEKAIETGIQSMLADMKSFGQFRLVKGSAGEKEILDYAVSMGFKVLNSALAWMIIK